MFEMSPGAHFDDTMLAEKDVIIAVVGATGVGKSSFIQLVTGNKGVSIGHTMRSCTDQIQPIRYHRPDGSGPDIVFLDTPGFDDTYRTDTDILIDIADWLTRSYKCGVMLTGLLFLHRISDNRMTGTSWRNANVFESICGKGALQNVVLVTTMWDIVQPSMGFAREKELEEKYWDPMITAGARMARFDHTIQGAWNILDQFTNTLPRPVKLQEQMVDEGLPLAQTDAGVTHFGWLNRLIAQFRRMIEVLEDLLRGFSKRGDVQIKKELELKKSDAQQNVHYLSEQKEQLVSSSPQARSDGTSFLEPRGESNAGRMAVAAGSVLKIVKPLADIAPVPFLSGILSLALMVASSIEAMEHNQKELKTLSSNTHMLVCAIKAQTPTGVVSGEVKSVVRDLCEELEQVQKIIAKVASNRALNRFIFPAADKEVIISCNDKVNNALRLFDLRSRILMLKAIDGMAERKVRNGITL